MSCLTDVLFNAQVCCYRVWSPHRCAVTGCGHLTGVVLKGMVTSCVVLQGMVTSQVCCYWVWSPYRCAVMGCGHLTGAVTGCGHLTGVLLQGVVI